MALHIVRDFASLDVSTPVASMYFTAIFLRTVMGFTVIGHTNFALDGGTLTIDSGIAGAISAAEGFTNRFTPDGYTVSLSDVDRILVIKSTNNPLLTSGLWRVIGVDMANNQFILGLRGEPPVIESGLTWRLHPAETTLALSNGTNGNTGQYRGRTSGSSTSRIIMQSPHASAWQVRLTYETSTDFSTAIKSKFTFAPGFGGDSIGDFPVGGDHLHGALWRNVNNSSVVGLTVGYGGRDVTALTRYYMWGEDSTGSCVFITRSITDSSVESFGAFGLPEDEEYPDDTRLVRRLFAWGLNRTSGNDVKFTTGQSQSGYPNLGVAFGYSGQPITCAASCYGYLSGQQLPTNGPYFDVNGADNPFLAVTELLTVDLFAGTWDHGDISGQDPVILLEPRRLGRFPIARIGRSNFGDYTTSTDGQRTWIHTRNGVYLPWYGSILP